MVAVFVSQLLLTVCAIAIPAEAVGKDFVIRRDADVTVFMPKGLKPVAHTALQMLANDMHDVLGAKLHETPNARRAQLLCAIDSTMPREGFRLSVSKQTQLNITAADDHGLAYGLLEVSRLLGVSPWCYWADCTPRPKNELRLWEGIITVQQPAVAFRGIFINDEDLGLNPWATKQEPEALTLKQGRIVGAIGPKVNERIFQLMLRLRANYYWPAMHECSQPFYTIAGNREMAARYGIYLGGSHCEPMATSPAAEWDIRGTGNYDYVNNHDAVMQFFGDRVDEVKDQDVVYTIGMRGKHDGAMEGVKTMTEKVSALQSVINEQRAMLADKVNKDTAAVPQLFVPYKEVLDIYRSGLHVPDDVTLMWTDDNYGYVRHFPDSVERQRSGGNGLYYHISYWGRPCSYLWLGTFSPRLMQHQLVESYLRGIRKMWIVNVGDIKPLEYQVELFLDMAWQGPQMTDAHMRHFYACEFGEDLADTLTDIMQRHYELAFDRKPEHITGCRIEERDMTYWQQPHPIAEWSAADVRRRVAAYQQLSDAVEHIYNKVSADRRDAFIQLVKFPVQCAAQVNFKFLCPERAAEATDSIKHYTNLMNTVVAGGKWDGMFDCSTRIRQQHFRDMTAADVPTYPERPDPIEADNPHEGEYTFGTVSQDSVTVEVRLLPTHPVTAGHRLAFSIQLDGGEAQTAEYQTYDREEEWKQNVLRNYAVRRFRLPVDKHLDHHRIIFRPLTDGVYIRKILILQ